MKKNMKELLNSKLDNKVEHSSFKNGDCFYTCDGKVVNTIDEVMLYNNMYYDRMMNRSCNDYSENKILRR